MKYKATITYNITVGDIEWNNLYIDHMNITGLEKTLLRDEIVQRMKDGWHHEFISSIVYGAMCEAQTGDLNGTLYFGYRTDEATGHMEFITDGDPWWRFPNATNDELKLLGTDDWWKEHDTEDESNAAIGRVVYEATETGWDYEGV
jgi:hypothetical protein